MMTDRQWNCDVTIDDTYVWRRLWPDHVKDYDWIDDTKHRQ